MKDSIKDEAKKYVAKTVLKFVFSLKGLLIIGGTALAIFLFAYFIAIIVIITESGEECDNGGNSGDKTLGSLPTDGNAEQNAKMLFEHMVKVEGASGAGAAAVTAVSYRESNLNPKAVNPGGGVAGILQWSGWGHQVNGNRITSEGSIKDGDMSTLTMENELKLLHHELSGDYKSSQTAMSKAKDPAQAAAEWSEKYEGVAASDSQTKSGLISNLANKYYKQFGGSDIEGNPALGGANKAAKNGEDNAETEENNNCSTSDDGGSGADGYGLPVKGEYSLGLGTYPSYEQGSTSHDHNGVDFQSKGLTELDVQTGTKKAGVYAVHNGKVQSVQHSGDQYMVVIRHSDKKYSYYGHSMKQPPVKAGDVISRGQLVNYQGYGGDVRPKNIGAAHVHFGMSENGQSFGPDAKGILSPADYLPLPKSVTPDGTSGGLNDRVTGSGFSKYFKSEDTDKASKQTLGGD